MPAKRTRDLIIQLTNGDIHFISESQLGEPVTGHPTGVKKLRSSLAKHRGKAVGLRAAVMGYPLPNQLAENDILTVIERDLTRAADRAAAKDDKSE